MPAVQWWRERRRELAGKRSGAGYKSPHAPAKHPSRVKALSFVRLLRLD